MTVNPLLVREVRRILRGRAFPYSLLAILTALSLPALIANPGLGSAGDGRSVFGSLLPIYAFYAWLIVPFYGVRWVWEERRDDTWDILSLTSLGCGSMLFGRLAAGLGLLGLMLACFAPFVSFAYLLRGLDVQLVLLSVVVVVAIAVVLLLVGIFLSTLATHRMVWAGTATAFLGGLAVLYGGFLDVFERAMRRGRLPDDLVAFVLGAAIPAAIVVAVATRARLAPSASDYAFPPRVAVVAAIALWLAATLAISSSPWGAPSLLILDPQIWSIPALSLTTCLGLAAAGEPEVLSRRIRRDPRRWRSPLLALFRTGSGRGFGLAVLLAAGIGTIHVVATEPGARADRLLLVPILAAYVAACLGTTLFLSRFLPERVRTPALLRLGPFVLAAILGAIGGLRYVIQPWSRRTLLATDLLSPIYLGPKLKRASDGDLSPEGAALLVVFVAAVAVAVNAPFVWRSIREATR